MPDVGGVGQERLLAAAVKLDVTDPAGRAAARYLAAAGLGALVFDDAALAADLIAQNPDVRIYADADVPTLPIAPLDLTPGIGTAHADALVRGGAAACRLIHHLVSS